MEKRSQIFFIPIYDAEKFVECEFWFRVLYRYKKLNSSTQRILFLGRDLRYKRIACTGWRIRVYLDPDSWSKDEKGEAVLSRATTFSTRFFLSLSLLYRYNVLVGLGEADTPGIPRVWLTIHVDDVSSDKGGGWTERVSPVRRRRAPASRVHRRDVSSVDPPSSPRMVSTRTPGGVTITSSSANDSVAGNGVADSTASSHDESHGTTTNGLLGQEWNQSSGPPSLSMSVDLHNLVSSNLTDSGRYSASPDHHQAATTADTTTTIKIGCHDEEESYEGFGSVEGDSVGDDGLESPGGSSSAPSPTGNSHKWVIRWRVNLL